MSREMEFKAWLKNKKKMIKVKAIDFIEEQIRGGANWYDFNEIELMQYTGLKDKKGVKIFEGDIVKFNGKLYKVIWDNGECRFSLTNSVENTFLLLTSWRMPRLEVISNIYENPELLGENND